MSKIKVLVTHPARQHSHQLAYALQSNGYLQKYITSLWYKSKHFPYSYISKLPLKYNNRIERELYKRYYPKLNDELVEQVPYFMIIRLFFEYLIRKKNTTRGILYQCRIFDYYVSSRIKFYRPDIVLGYNLSSLYTFKKSLEYSAITVLDLTQVHYNYISNLSNKYDYLKEEFAVNKLVKEINHIKEEEFKLADYILVLSSYAKQTMIENGVSPDKLIIHRIGVDQDIFTKKNIYPINSKFQITFVGSLTRRKGLNLLLESIKQINKNDIELNIIGGKADASDLLEEYQGYFNYHSYQNQNDIIKYYKNSDVLILPSYLDSWGIVVVEAMACGIPVIVSENTGSKDIVEHGYNGFIIPVDDINSLKNKILYLYANRSILSQLGQNAYNTANKLNTEYYIKHVNDIILNILHRNKVH